MDNALKTRVGRLVAGARKAAGLSQADVAARIGLHEDSISNIERGAVLPTIGTLLDLADAFGLPVQDLVPASNEKVTAARLAVEAEIKAAVRKAPDHRLEAIRDQVLLIANLK